MEVIARARFSCVRILIIMKDFSFRDLASKQIPYWDLNFNDHVEVYINGKLYGSFISGSNMALFVEIVSKE